MSKRENPQATVRKEVYITNLYEQEPKVYHPQDLVSRVVDRLVDKVLGKLIKKGFKPIRPKGKVYLPKNAS